jgi:phosphoribosyl-AMP cyclohydrolase / phosphoribosyl-ATP pyrophosphohydrolase
MNIQIEQLAWEKMQGLLPAIVQHADSGKVLMLGYMDREALAQTLQTKKLYFYSRSKKRLWMKGESSGNYLELVNISVDCDQDALLVMAKPIGPTCHEGRQSCFLGGDFKLHVLHDLEQLILKRQQSCDANSYSYQLLSSGIERITQKVGEEAVETVIASISRNYHALCEESADLLFHLLILLCAQQLSLLDVVERLKNRMS